MTRSAYYFIFFQSYLNKIPAFAVKKTSAILVRKERPFLFFDYKKPINKI